MSMQTDEAYRLFCNVRNGDTAIEFFFIDAICYCLFDDYEEGAAGYEPEFFQSGGMVSESRR